MLEKPFAPGPRRSSAILLLCLVTAGSFAGADDGFVPVYRPSLAVQRAAGPIDIDANLGDPGWVGAARAANFAEHTPGDQTQPAVDTQVWITYDDTNLYVAFRCQEDSGKVRASHCERDDIFSDDCVFLLLDTYGDATWAYEIAVNPYGIPGDLLFSSSYGEDISYDLIYKSAGRIHESGWVVEMAIPFRSLRFPDRDDQVWRVDFWRNRPRESRYQYSWAAYDRDETCWPCKWGTVTGISGVESGAGFELLPSVVGHQSGALNGDGTFENGNIDGEVGLGIAYDFSSELMAEATLNPDFSQVESDAAQIDVNSTFALFYPEKRPFFQEGSDLFSTYFEAVYTRSINDPSVAGKMTLRKGSNSAAFLSARDQHSVIILPFEESSEFVENGKSYSNILRARHDFGEQTHLGAVLTDRRFDGGGSGSLVGADAQIRLSRSNTFRFQLLGTHTNEVDNPALTDSSLLTTSFGNGRYTATLDGESFWGHGFFATLNRETRNYWLGVDYMEKSPTFRADNGFEPSNDSRLPSAWIGGIVRFDENKLLENINGSVNAARKWNFDGVKKDEWIDTSVSINLRTAQTGSHLRYLASNELFGGVQFDGIWLVHACLNSRPIGGLEFGGNYNFGHRIARNSLVMGNEISYGAWVDIRPVSRLLLSPSFSRVTSDEVETGERLFSQSVFRARASIQLLRELSARVILQYNDRYKSWDVDPLLRYQINPLSIFYVGSTRNYRDLDPTEDPIDGWALTSRQYFMKIQYLFQM